MALRVKRGLQEPLALLDYQAQWYAMVPLTLQCLNWQRGWAGGNTFCIYPKCEMVLVYLSFTLEFVDLSSTLCPHMSLPPFLQGPKGEAGDRGRSEMVRVCDLALHSKCLICYNSVL